MSDLTAGSDVFACVVVAVEHDGPLAGVWIPGPLQIELPILDAQGRTGDYTTSDRSARSSFFASRVVDTLYTADSETSRGRWHMDGSSSELDGARLLAWECLVPEAGRGQPAYAVAHLQLGDNPLSTLADLTRPTGALRGHLMSLLPDGLRAGARTSIGLISHVVHYGELTEPDERDSVLAATAGWSAVDRWLWFSATGVEADSFMPDPASQRPGTTVHLSADWRGLALRSGLAFVALTPQDAGPHELLRTYVRSIHLDGFLLVQLQADAAQELADELSRTRIERLTLEEATEMEGRLLSLRTVLWWRHLTGRGSQVDQVVRALQEERGLPELYDQLVSEMTDTARFLELLRNRADLGRERKVNQIVSLASAAFVTPSVFLAAAAVVPDPSRTLQIIFWLAAAVLAIATWFVMRWWLSSPDRRLGD